MTKQTMPTTTKMTCKNENTTDDDNDSDDDNEGNTTDAPIQQPYTVTRTEETWEDEYDDDFETISRRSVARTSASPKLRRPSRPIPSKKVIAPAKKTGKRSSASITHTRLSPANKKHRLPLPSQSTNPPNNFQQQQQENKSPPFSDILSAAPGKKYLLAIELLCLAMIHQRNTLQLMKKTRYP